MRKVLHLQKARRKIIAKKRARRKCKAIGRKPSALWQAGGKLRYISNVEIWNGDEPEDAICIRKPTPVPEVMCLEDTPQDTLHFLDNLRTRMQQNFMQGGKDFVRRKPGRKPVLHGYADFSNVKHISTAAALMLAAEYDRIKERVNKVPPAVNLYDWSNEAFATLFEVGFFEVVGISDDAGQKMHSTGERKTIRIIQMDDGDNKLNEIDVYLEELYEFVFPGASIPEDLRTNILTSLSEAISNVADHAYKDPSFPYKIPPINRSWVTASADRALKSLTVVVFDQGAGIPYTYPRQNLLDSVKRAVHDFLRNAGGDRIDGLRDDTYIEAAMRYGNSRTNLAHRGKGLPQMSDLIDVIGNGQMSVYSGNGWWRKSGNSYIETGVTEAPVGGTLIDWTIRIENTSNEI